MNDLLKEIRRQLQRIDVAVTTAEDETRLHINHADTPLCIIESQHGKTAVARWQPNDYTIETYQSIFEKVGDLLPNVTEYVQAYENAPPLGGVDSPDKYRCLIEYKGVVLASHFSPGHEMNPDYGYQFVTWDRTFDGKGVCHGHYYKDYRAAKEDFAARSGLVNQNRLFNNEQLSCFWRALNFSNSEDTQLSYEAGQQYKELMGRIEFALPDEISRDLHSGQQLADAGQTMGGL